MSAMVTATPRVAGIGPYHLPLTHVIRIIPKSCNFKMLRLPQNLTAGNGNGNGNDRKTQACRRSLALRAMLVNILTIRWRTRNARRLRRYRYRYRSDTRFRILRSPLF